MKVIGIRWICEGEKRGRRDAIAELQRNPSTARLSDEALLGLHTNCARKVDNWVKAWQGLASS